MIPITVEHHIEFKTIVIRISSIASCKMSVNPLMDDQLITSAWTSDPIDWEKPQKSVISPELRRLVELLRVELESWLGSSSTCPAQAYVVHVDQHGIAGAVLAKPDMAAWLRLCWSHATQAYGLTRHVCVNPCPPHVGHGPACIAS